MGEVAREELDELAQYYDTSPVPAGGDIDADWQRAAASGEEAVGGTVSTSDQDRVDNLGKAVGVKRSPDAPFRQSRTANVGGWGAAQRAPRLGVELGSASLAVAAMRRDRKGR